MPAKESAFWTERKAELWALGQEVKMGKREWASVAARFGATIAACRLKYDRLAADPAFHRPAVVEGEPSKPTDPKKLWERAKEATAEDAERFSKQRLASAVIDDDRPIAIAAISDQHIAGGGAVDLARMEADAKLIARTPGLYALLGGDGVDNHIKHRSGMVSRGGRIKDDWRRFDHYLGFFGDSILGMISGNHDDWTRDFTDVDMVQTLAAKHRVHYAPDEMLLSVQLPGHTYAVKIRHQYRFNSQFNLLHVVKRLWEMGEDPFDIGVVCHHHEVGLELFTKQGKDVWGARPGAYLLGNGHSRRFGYGISRPACPTFVLWPHERRIVGFKDVRDGADYLTWARKAYRRQAA